MGGSVKRSGFDPLQRLLLSALLLAVLFFGSTATCYGATLKTIPSTNLSVAYSNKLLLGYHNYTATWSGVSGKMIKGKYNYDLLCVPIKTKTGSFTYTNFLDLNFTNVGKINGRQLDAKVHFNSMTVGKRNASGERGDNYFAVCYLADESMWMSSTIAGIGAGYRAPKTIDITTTMYWHDTGKVVNLPFFQCLSDIDAGANYFKEAWEAKSGFSGIFYKYSPCFLRFSGNRAATPKATDVGGNDSLWKSGFYAPTTGGTFRGVFTEGNCATQFMPYSAYTMMSNPVKSSDSRDRNVEGDEIDYTITQKIGKFYVDIMTPYSSFVMTDRLPEGLSYQSAAIYDGSGRDITSQGSLSYDESSRTVSFTMGASWLASIDNYSGQTLSMKIKTRVDPVGTPLKTVKNSATTIIDKEVKLTSNEICDTLAIPYHAKYEYVCGTKGRKLPKEISTQSGAYQVSDESAYYQGDTVKRKEAPEDGTVYKVVDGDGEEKALDFHNMLGVCTGYMSSPHEDQTCDTHRGNIKLEVDPRSQESVAQIAYRADGTIYSENVLINRDLNETLNLNCERAYLKANRKAAITALQKFCLRQRQNGTWDITVLKKAEQYFGQEKEGMKRPYLGATLFFINRYSQKNS